MPTKPQSQADAIFAASPSHDKTAKEIAAKERADLDVKLARLRALRLAKEAADKEAAQLNPAAAAPRKRAIRKRS